MTKRIAAHAQKIADEKPAVRKEAVSALETAALVDRLVHGECPVCAARRAKDAERVKRWREKRK